MRFQMVYVRRGVGWEASCQWAVVVLASRQCQEQKQLKMLLVSAFLLSHRAQDLKLVRWAVEQEGSSLVFWALEMVWEVLSPLVVWVRSIFLTFLDLKDREKSCSRPYQCRQFFVVLVCLLLKCLPAVELQ